MTFFSIIKKIIFWSYDRGSWQYDLLCVVILAFIFLMPKSLFQAPTELTYIATAEIYRAEAGAHTNLRDLLATVISQKYQRKISINRVEVDADAAGNIRGYRVWLNQ